MGKYIRCNGKAEFDLLMEYLESLNYKWDCGEKPTEFTPGTLLLLEDTVVYVVIDDDVITYEIGSTSSVYDTYTYYMATQVSDKVFGKFNLINNMIVELRNGDTYLYMSYCKKFVRAQGYLFLDSYTYDLRDKTDARYDIVRVYEPKNFNSLNLRACILSLTPIFDRDEKPVTMTIAEIEEKLGIKNLKIVKEKEDE